MWFGVCASTVTYLTNTINNQQHSLCRHSFSSFFLSSFGSTLTYFVLRLVHPVIIIIILISVCSMKVSVRVRVRVAMVDSVELALAVEDASALAGEGGHAEPAESPGQARRFLLPKGRRPPVPPHPRSDKMAGCGIKTSLKPRFNPEK